MPLNRILQLVEASKRDDYIIVGSELREVAMFAFEQRKIAEQAINILDLNRHMLNAQQLVQLADLRAKL